MRLNVMLHVLNIASLVRHGDKAVIMPVNISLFSSIKRVLLRPSDEVLRSDIKSTGNTRKVH